MSRSHAWLVSFPALMFACVVATTGPVRPARADSFEDLFAHQYDLTGQYTIAKGMTPDSSDYKGTVEIGKPQVVTTPRGTKINFYPMTWKIGDDKPLPGVGVQAGSRLYVAYGSGKHYALTFLGNFEMPSDLKATLQQRDQMWEKTGKKEVVTWKGKQPWWWDMTTSTDSYGYFFRCDNSWGQAAAIRSKNHWQISFHYLKKNGDLDGVFDLLYYMNVTHSGEDLDLTWRKWDDKEKDAFSDRGMLGDASGEWLFGSWGGSSDGGLGYYDFKDKQLVGFYVLDTNDDKRRGIEILDAPDNVVTGASALFGK